MIKKYLRLLPSLCFSFFLFIIFLPGTPAGSADAQPPAFSFDKTQIKIKEISRQIKSGKVSPPQLENAKQQTERFIQDATFCIDNTTGEISSLEQEIVSLGPVAEQEPAEIIKERKNLNKQKQALQVTLSECRLVTTLATRLQNDLADQNKILQSANFFSRTQNFFGRFATTLPTADAFISQLSEYLTDRSGFGELSPVMILILMVLAGVGAFTGHKLFRLLQRQLELCHDRQSTEPLLPLKGRLALPISLAAGGSGSYLLHSGQDSTTSSYGPWLFFAVGLYSLSLLLFHLHNHFKPLKPESSPAPLPLRRFKVLALLSVLLFFFTHLNLADFNALAVLLGLSQSVIICMLCLIGWWLLWPIKPPDHLLRLEKSRRAGLTGISVLVMIIELSGYRNFSIFLLVGLLGTFLIFSLLRFALFSIDEIIGGFVSSKYQWQQGLRQKLGLPARERLTGISWLRIIFKILAWSTGILLFLQLWGLPDPDRQKLYTSLVDGFNLGGLIIAPARIVLGFFIFAGGWTLISWLKIQLEKRWLKNAGFSLSAQETLVTMTGYSGFAMALIFGLSAAGFSFSNLAVIAGALSVGIGFGLQNIVNNFVSGLIILFERPVKRGDWISIGNTEGYVQKISVRSTLIQTFDRSDVIVPNSELISNQVTNMMLNDNFGRLIVPVGVAYGSDTELVRTILLEIAEANDQVINDGSMPKPLVLFLEFGESSLNFELRCHLANIDRRLNVKSAINYEIDRAFRQHQIAMPFPQRDIYIKEFPSSAQVPAGEDKDGGLPPHEGDK